MLKYGLKLWSTNENYLKEAAKLFKNNLFDYIELYAVPNSFNEYSKVWEKLCIPFVIHAPHFAGGLNFGKKECEAKNLELANEAQKYANLLKADKIIFHPGVAGTIDETIRQIKLLAEPRALIENKPLNAIDSDLLCNGSTPEEIKKIMEETGIGFCFDVGHAICSAKAHGQEYFGYLREFMGLNPAMYHLTDGNLNNVQDEHKHIGQGDFDIKKIVKMLPSDAIMTIETDKDSEDNLNDFIKDIEAMRQYAKT